MITDLEETAFPALYARFVELFQGNKPWTKVVAKLQLQIKANPYSQPQILRENRAAYGLAIFDDGGIDIAGCEDWPNVQHAMAFAAQVCEIVDQTTDETGKQAYISRIRGAFSNPAEMRAIRFEHLTALALFRQGARIEWPETQRGAERFDILATDSNGTMVEVECKSCSPDKGRAITEMEATQFFPHLFERLEGIPQPHEVLMVKVRVPKRLPTSPKDLALLADEIVQAVMAGRSITEQGALIASRRYSAPMIFLGHPPEVVQGEVNAKAMLEFNGLEGHRAIKYTPGKPAAYCVEVCSGRSAKFFEATWETTKHAIQKQMTRSRPGCLVLRLEGMGKAELEQFAQEVPNTLVGFAKKVFLDERHQHLACLAYVSDETVTETSPGAKTPQSSSYVFDRPDGPYADLGIGQNLLGPFQEQDTVP